MDETLNMDCLIHIFSHLSMRDKLSCRLVCKKWLASVDKLFSGQQSLEIIARSQMFDQSNCSNFSILVDRKNLNFRVFNFMLHRFRNITTLTIRNMMELSDIVMFTITKNCTNLCTLSFCYCNGLTFNYNNEYSLFNSLTGYGWHLLTQAYPNLSSLTLRQCRLSEADLTKIISACDKLKYLDISDNQIVGNSVANLGQTIETLVCGDLSSEEPIETILMNITKGNGVNVKNLSVFGVLSSLKSFKKFKRLERLELHFCTEEELPDYLSDIGFLSLKSLVLDQIRCYQQYSAIDHKQFMDMLRQSKQLQKLVISGDFEWTLRLSDRSLESLVNLCPILEDLTISGNGKISDKGLLSLQVLPIRRLNLSLFQVITDSSMKTLLDTTAIRSLVLTDMPKITENLIIRAINLCQENQTRKINITLSTCQLNKKLLGELILPKNLKLKIDEQASSRVPDDEPTALQMMIVIAMSALILVMALLTTVVVVLIPLAMSLMMIHDYLWTSFVLDTPTITHFKSSFNFNVAFLRQAYVKLLYSLI